MKKCFWYNLIMASALLFLTVPALAAQKVEKKITTPVSDEIRKAYAEKKYNEVKAASTSDSSDVKCLLGLKEDAISKLVASCKDEKKDYMPQSFTLGKILYEKKKEGNWTCSAQARGICSPIDQTSK